MTTNVDDDPGITSKPWVVLVTDGHNISKSDDDVVDILTCCGCDQIETLGYGLARCRIPKDWVETLGRVGRFTFRAQLVGEDELQIDLIVLPAQGWTREAAPLGRVERVVMPD